MSGRWTDDPFAKGAPAPAAADGNFSGKWMILAVFGSQLDRWFVEAAKAVEAGEVYSAKAPAGPLRPNETGCVLMYTKDFRDRQDVTRAVGEPDVHASS